MNTHGHIQPLSEAPKEVRLTLSEHSPDYKIGEKVWHKRATYRVRSVIPKRLLVLELA